MKVAISMLLFRRTGVARMTVSGGGTDRTAEDAFGLYYRRRNPVKRAIRPPKAFRPAGSRSGVVRRPGL
jgi:hypothetical protein